MFGFMLACVLFLPRRILLKRSIKQVAFEATRSSLGFQSIGHYGVALWPSSPRNVARDLWEVRTHISVRTNVISERELKRESGLKLIYAPQGKTPKIISEGYLGDKCIQHLSQTAKFAERVHGGQFRAGGKKTPYVTHPFAVAAMIAGSACTETVCAAMLHDVMEDCGVKDQQILDLYPANDEWGQRVLAIVKEVTDPEGIPYNEKKSRQIAMMASGYSEEAALLKAADQTCNMQDLVATPPNWGKGEEEAYIVSMKKLVDARPSINPNIRKMFDQAYEAACKFYDMKS